jgi:hypothetical protein
MNVPVHLRGLSRPGVLLLLCVRRRGRYRRSVESEGRTAKFIDNKELRT